MERELPKYEVRLFAFTRNANFDGDVRCWLAMAKAGVVMELSNGGWAMPDSVEVVGVIDDETKIMPGMVQQEPAVVAHMLGMPLIRDLQKRTVESGAIRWVSGQPNRKRGTCAEEHAAEKARQENGEPLGGWMDKRHEGWYMSDAVHEREVEFAKDRESNLERQESASLAEALNGIAQSNERMAVAVKESGEKVYKGLCDCSLALRLAVGTPSESSKRMSEEWGKRMDYQADTLADALAGVADAIRGAPTCDEDPDDEAS